LKSVLRLFYFHDFLNRQETKNQNLRLPLFCRRIGIDIADAVNGVKNDIGNSFLFRNTFAANH